MNAIRSIGGFAKITELSYFKHYKNEQSPENEEDRWTVWAGLADIDYENKTVINIREDCEQYKTADRNDLGLMTRYALSQFQKAGYDTSETLIELRAFGRGAKDLPY